MPVFRANDSAVDIEPKSGKQRRHIAVDCPNYATLVTDGTASVKSKANTSRMQDETVRCEHPECWTKRVKIDGDKQATIRSKSTTGKKAASVGTGSKVSAKKAAVVAPVAVGGAAKSLADRAKVARQKPKAKQPAAA